MFKNLIVKFVLVMMTIGITMPMTFSVTYAQNSNTENELSQFDVSEYLKIPDGQTYLNQNENAKADSPNLKNGAVYFIIKLIELLTKIIGSFALLFMIAGGLVMMISHGNSQLQTRGKQMILYSLLGLVVAFTSLIIVTFVQSLFFTT